ncbi:MAG: FliI/YscN family ATPase [Pseudomonadota bacterium]
MLSNFGEADRHGNSAPALAPSLQGLASRISQAKFHREIGKVVEVTASRIVTNLTDVFVGERCILRDPRSASEIMSQVVSIQKDVAILSPLEGIEGLSARTQVQGTGEPYTIRVGKELLGCVVDGLGRTMDVPSLDMSTLERVSIAPQHSASLDRPVIDEIFETGIKSIDAFNTIGHGQRLGIFGEAGAGKSTLLSMLARHSEADVVVLALIGERGREVNEFLERQMPPEVRQRSVVIASTSDRPAMERIMAAHVAATISEYFRAQGKRVLLLFDSVTRFARALREVGLASGEQAIRSGFTPSVYAELPKLIERSGKTRDGSITAFYTVLNENDGVNDPISEEVASLTDGHIILDAALARGGVYPAINVLKSKSRLMNEIAPQENVSLANNLRRLMAKYLEIELLVQVGEYSPGSDPAADQALRIHPLIQKFLSQGTHEHVAQNETVSLMQEMLNA